LKKREKAKEKVGDEEGEWTTERGGRGRVDKRGRERGRVEGRVR
jgi:hypothetical protein